MRTLVLTLCLLLSTLSIDAQSFDRTEMDSLFSLIEEHDKGMGSLSIFQDGEEVYQRAYGYADLENRQKANKETRYRVGSISKTFTATVIMKLIEEGKLSLDTFLNSYYPQIPNADRINIRHLLQHRSGIRNFLEVEGYLTWNGIAHSKEELLEKIESIGTSFSPDERFEYSNSNYVLLTYIAEDASGKPFSDLLDEIVLLPAGLKNTYIGEKIDPTKNEAYSYLKLTPWKREKETDMSIPLGAGFIVSTPTDLNTFLNKLFSGEIVSQESLEQMTKLKDNFGLGLFRTPFYEMSGYGHTGGIDGFQAHAVYFPETKLAIALTCNAVDYPRNDILLKALQIYYRRDAELPKFTAGIVLQAEELVKYLGVYSTPMMPLKLTITQDGNTLIAQGTNQPAFALECTDVNTFQFLQAGLVLLFIPEEGKMILKQQGMSFEMTRE